MPLNCVAEGEGGRKKSFRLCSRLFLSYLVPRTRCLSRRQPQQTSLTAGERPRVLEPEPRGNLRAAPTQAALSQVATRLRGPTCCCTPCLRHTGPPLQKRGAFLADGSRRYDTYMSSEMLLHLGHLPPRPCLLGCLKVVMTMRWLIAPPLPTVSSCPLYSYFPCCLMVYFLLMCTLGLPEQRLDGRAGFCSNKTEQNTENMDNSSDGSWLTQAPTPLLLSVANP